MVTSSRVDQARARGSNRQSDAMRVRDDPSFRGTATATDGSTLERDAQGNVFRYVPKYDYTIRTSPDGVDSAPMRGNQLPNSMNKYMDKVLQMSGMNDGDGDELPSTGPVPADRPATPAADPQSSGMTGTENNPGKLADDTLSKAGDSNAATLGEAILGLLGGGAVGGALKSVYDRVRNSSPVDAMIDAVDGASPAPDAAAQAAPNTQGALPEPEARAALPAPPQQLPAPEAAAAAAATPQSNVDASIAAIDGPPDRAALPAPQPKLTDADAPYSARNPAPQSSGTLTDGDAPYSSRNPAATPEARRAVIEGAVNMPPRDAIRYLQANGISLSELAPEEVRILADASNRMKSAAREGISGVVRSAVRGGMR